jgi:ABC-type molybdenum transport system ATPase subunit/photorepair protein PhrA
MPIVITGERGAGKTSLYSALIDYHSQRRPEVSANAETERVSIGNKLS